jgi:hypothetical protein
MHNTRYALKLVNMVLSVPILDGKVVLDVNVARLFGRFHGIDDANGRDIDFLEDAGVSI